MQLIKYLLPLALLCCKAKIQQEQIKCKDTIVFDCKKDTSMYHWSDNFSDNELRELCRNGNLMIK